MTEITPQMYAGDRPDVALSLQIHASCLRQLGDIERRRELYEQARELHEQALAIYERLFGRDVEEVDVAWNLIALAADLRELGDVRQARELDGQALALLRRLYDGDHSALADGLSGLAADLRELGEVERTQELDVEAAAMRARLPAAV